MKKSDQQGFTAVEVLLGLILVVILALAGYYVWHSQNSDTRKSATTTHPTTPAVSKTTTKTAEPVAGTEVVRTTLPKAPASLQTAVTTHTQQSDPGCINSSGQFLNDAGAPDTPTADYVDNNAAFVGVCQTANLYAFTSGQWKFISKTQFGFECTQLKQYHVLPALVKTQGNGQCLDASGNFVAYQ